MSDYDELSFLRQLAVKQMKEINAYQDFKMTVVAATVLIVEGKSVEAETLLLRAIQTNDSNLKQLKQNG